MKCRIFTLLFAFLAIAGNAVWGQSTITINGTSISTNGGSGWSYSEGNDDNNVLTISTAGTYTIKGTGTGSGNNTNIQIILSGQGKYNITFDNFRTDARLGEVLQQDPVYDNRSALTINSGAIVTLSWTGINKFWSSPQCAGINVKDGAELILKGNENDGYLEAGSLNNSDNKHTDGAGIGGDANDPNFGTIVIESGVVKARCESKTASEDARAAGIGGGYGKNNSSSTKGTIIIKGGKIEAACWSVEQQTDYESNRTGNQYSYGAGIGGGYQGTCTNIAILGGEVIANSNGAEDIGVGKDYTGSNGIEKGIIIGQWAENTDTPIVKTINNGNATINDVNIVKGEEGSLKGNVTMPKETQMYTTYDLVFSDQKFYSYQLNPLSSIINDSENGTHSSTFSQATRNIANYYLGANQPFDLPELSCDMNHIFMGWIEAKETNADFVALNNDKCSMITPNTDATQVKQYLTYYPVWVDNDKNILVVSGTNWDEKDTPIISVVPDNALDKLAFSFKDAISDEELKGITFKDNKLSGTPTLQDGDTYFSKDVKATVKWNTGNITSEQEITLHIAIVNEVLINSVDINVANNPHIYNGQHHNGYAPNEDDHSLVVKMKKTSDGTALNPEDENLTDGVGYRIYSFTVTNGNESNNPKASDADEEPLPIINAGTYSNITIQALNATFGEEFNGQIKDNSLYTLGNDAKIIVNQRPMNISISFNKQSIEEDEKLTWDDDVTVTIQREGEVANEGLVEKDNDIQISGTIEYIPNEDKTSATVKITNIKIDDATEFKNSNYLISINGSKNTYPNDGTEIEIEDVPIVQPSDDNDRPGHIDRPAKYYNIYIDTVCPGLKLELSKDVVKEGGQVSVYLTVEEQCDTTGFAFEYKRGLFGRWEDLKPLEGVQPGEYIIKLIYHDIYIRALDATMPEEEPTGIEDVEGMKVYAQDGNIYVYTPNRERVMIVSMNGALVKNAEQEGMQSYSVSRGIYIVRIGDKVFKIKN